jgi:hypothetical protein
LPVVVPLKKKRLLLEVQPMFRLKNLASWSSMVRIGEPSSRAFLLGATMLLLVVALEQAKL